MAAWGLVCGGRLSFVQVLSLVLVKYCHSNRPSARRWFLWSEGVALASLLLGETIASDGIHPRPSHIPGFLVNPWACAGTPRLGLACLALFFDFDTGTVCFDDEGADLDVGGFLARDDDDICIDDCF